MSNHSIIHEFAQQKKDEGRCGNIFYYGTKIYSYGYHYVLGTFIDKNTILINDEGYSRPTSKHMSILRSATSQYTQLFTSDTDVNVVVATIKEAVLKLKSATKPEKYITEIINSFERFSELEEQYVFISKVHEDFKEVKRIYTACKKDSAKYVQAQKARLKLEKAKESVHLKKQLKKFFSYEIEYIPRIKEDFLRVSEDGAHIETTQKVKVSIDSAKILYSLIKNGVDIRGHRIDGYVVTSLNGHLTIGCHKINVANMHEVGHKILNLKK